MTATNKSPAEYKRTVWFHEAKAGTTMDAVLSPEYWAHYAREFRPCDRIEVIWEDMTKVADLLVLSVGTVTARVWPLTVADMDPTPAQETTDHEVKWVSPTRKFGVLRTTDKQTIRDGFGTKPEAEAWLAQYLAGIVKAA